MIKARDADKTPTRVGESLRRPALVPIRVRYGKKLRTV
jgi:hypothetical protein